MQDDAPKHKHLRRLDQLWIDNPVYFVTTNVKGRRPLLADAQAVGVMREVWENAEGLYGWCVGAYVVMPDHVHFFCAPKRTDAEPLGKFVGKWKEWTTKHLHRRHARTADLWQDEFFDHVLRSDESFTQKWLYVQQNPVRAGLVAKAEDWPYWGVMRDLSL